MARPTPSVPWRPASSVACYACAEILPEPKASRVALVADWVSQRPWQPKWMAASARAPPPLQQLQLSHQPLFRPAVAALQVVDHQALAEESPQLQRPA